MTAENYLLHFAFFPSDSFHTFFYQGVSATADEYDDLVLSFAHGEFYGAAIERQLFEMYADEYYLPPFEYRFEINTPIPYHAEIHINRTLFDYGGEYFITYRYTHLRPNFVINVNGTY